MGKRNRGVLLVKYFYDVQSNTKERKPECIKIDEAMCCGKDRNTQRARYNFTTKEYKTTLHHYTLQRGIQNKLSLWQVFLPHDSLFTRPHASWGTGVPSWLRHGPRFIIGWSRLHVSHLSSKHLGLDTHYSCPFQVFLLHYHFTMFPCMSSQLS